MLLKHPHLPLSQYLRVTVAEALAEQHQRDHLVVIAAVAKSANATAMATWTTAPSLQT